MPRRILLLLAFVSWATTVRPPPVLLHWERGVWKQALPRPARIAIPTLESDFNGDGKTERLALDSGRAILLDGGLAVWSSPAEWDVRAAQVADLTRDGSPEAALLVWRPFAPWPVDAWLPHGGRIEDFHDSANRSCHIILLGWSGSEYREIWAGSALAQPVLAFFAADWNGDGRQDLAAVEAEYEYPARARAIALWEWNGFGFSLDGRRQAGFSAFVFMLDEENAPLFMAGLSSGIRV